MFTDLHEIGEMFDHLSVFDAWQSFEHRSYFHTGKDLSWVRGLHSGASRLNGPLQRDNRRHSENWLERQKADPAAHAALKAYKREWMRRKRMIDPKYYARELERQRQYDKNRRERLKRVAA